MRVGRAVTGTMGYRRDIQILRGVAILFLLLLHLQAPGAGSGFSAVDGAWPAVWLLFTEGTVLSEL